ncbi:MAG TPA: hotdog fold thioesterase [Candidatus Binataceae bacterium]|nr:hotdog fold thioesterase [Candidatus Binataceae bacterium]
MAQAANDAVLSELESGPFSAALRLGIERRGAGEATVRMPFAERILNAGGPDVPIHGGAIAALADFAACAAVWTMPETSSSATISITVNYSAPAIRTDLIAHARVRRAGRRVASVAVEIRDAQGALVADSLVTYKIA